MSLRVKKKKVNLISFMHKILAKYWQMPTRDHFLKKEMFINLLEETM